ncbi:MAG: hypothetical protein RL701_3239 [Pseudomonadota bacterium]
MSYETSNHSAPYAIVVALTFDETGVNALREAARIAELHPASQLHVVHVVSQITTRSSSRKLVSVERRLERAPDVMRRYVEHVWSNVPRKVIGHLRVGVPSRAILQTAADVNAELVVVGTHRRSGVKKLMLGSVAEQVVRHAHCPVFIAMPKDYSTAGKKTRSERPEPPCPHCLDVRHRSAGAQLWCPQHGQAPVAAPIYRPAAPVAPALAAQPAPHESGVHEIPVQARASMPPRAAAQPRISAPPPAATRARPPVPPPAAGHARTAARVSAVVPPLPRTAAAAYAQPARAREPR